MRSFRFLAVTSVAMLLASCTSIIRFQSLPWPTNVDVHDKETIDFLKKFPPIDEKMGHGLAYKDMAKDQRLVGLAISGGGARAAAFTLGVMSELQNVRTTDGSSNALERIDFMSSISGGGWAAAAYLNYRAASKDPQNFNLEEAFPEIRDDFVSASNGDRKCWSRTMRNMRHGNSTFGKVYDPNRAYKLPRVYFNAALMPAHSPFLFTDGFFENYQVTKLGACSDEEKIPFSGLKDLKISYAAATSGSVPAFYYAYAETDLCNDNNKSFCHPQKGGAKSYLRLVDGGLYDNIGYKAAYELMHGFKNDKRFVKRAMITINTGTSTDFKTISPSKKKNHFLLTTAKNGVFAVQDSTFERWYKPIFQSIGVEQPLLLNFYSTANFMPKDEQHLKDMDMLADKAARQVDCFIGNKYLKAESSKLSNHIPTYLESLKKLKAKGGDCLSENFYRVGTLGKTTYKINKNMFTILWQLGRLSVKMNEAEIRDAID